MTGGLLVLCCAPGTVLELETPGWVFVWDAHFPPIMIMQLLTRY